MTVLDIFLVSLTTSLMTTLMAFLASQLYQKAITSQVQKQRSELADKVKKIFESQDFTMWEVDLDEEDFETQDTNTKH